MLRWLRTGAWPKFTDIIAAIRQELQSVQPIDTASIRWEKDAEGMRAYYTGRTGGGEGLTVDEGGESAAVPPSVLIRIGAKVDEFGAYSCTLFDNGLALPATGSGIAYALESSFGGELVSGTVFIAHRAQVVVQDGEFYEDGEHVPGGEE